MKRLLWIAIVLSALYGCGSREKDLSFTMRDGLSPADAQLAEQGLRTLIEACPGIARYWGDMRQYAAVDVRPATLDEDRNYGWKRAVSVAIKVSDRPDNVPREYYAAGNSCLFNVGFTEPVGVAATKKACISVCTDTDQNETYALIRPKSK